MSKKGKIVIFSAPSGSGKTTIVKHLLSLDLGLEFSISATSRNPRGTEKDGVDYFFLTPEKFKQYIEEDRFIEWEEVYENQFYGTLRSEIENLINQGKHVLFDIDVVGGVNLKKEFGDQALSVFVRPPSVEVLEQRLRKRGTDHEEQLQKRIKKVSSELEYDVHFDKILVNDNLQESLRIAEEMVRDFIELGS